jgi:ribosomal protein S12 methylthiotransferase
MHTVKVVTLGCSKNLVDSERVLKMLSNAGLDAVHEGDGYANIVIINTCGFIGDAKEESVNTILEYAEAKNNGKIEELYVMGCLSERYRDELQKEIHEVDRFYGKFDWTTIADDLSRKHGHPSLCYDRTITTPSHHAYLKIAEGCNRFCAFCAIPLITGRYKSRPIEEIEDEVRMLVGRGVKEFNVIAQDLSGYGQDLYGVQKLPELVDRLSRIEGVKWIRLHYAYPAQFPMEVMDVMANRPNVCAYLDIALQHISDKVLLNMRRHITADETRALLAEMRRRVPGLHIRTTLMTGFPGETEEDFEELLRFVEEQRFERMGAFAYCEEEGTYGAENYDDSIPEDVKQNRLDRLMDLQERISMELQQQKIGHRLEVVIDREEEEFYVGRTQWDSPEVDPEVLVKKDRTLMIGGFYEVEVKEALPFELIAVVV